MVRLLTADAGNSTLDLKLHPDGQRGRLAVPARDLSALDEFLDATQPDACVAVTVREAALEPLLARLARRGVPLRLVGRELRCPLPLDYLTPQTLGADRWLGALAAHRRFGRSLVVDCGSATTVNLVEADGTFCGGPIAPGLGALCAGMAAVTPALPAAVMANPISMPPRASQAAVDAGVLHGYCGLVERLVADMLRAAGGPANVVVTGGNGELLLRHARLRAVLIGDLVHAGLAILAEGCTWSS